MAAVHSAGEAVARIAYLSSDVVISVQSSLANETESTKVLKRAAANKAPSLVCKNTPEIQSVRQNADPFLSVFQPARSGRLTTVITDSSVLVKGIPHLYKLARHPVVIHVSLQERADYGDITSVRSTGLAFLQSNTLQEAQDIAVTAHALAIRSGKGVIHFYNPADSRSDEPIATESTELVASVLNVDLARPLQAINSNDSNLYVSEGNSRTSEALIWTGHVSPSQSETPPRNSPSPSREHSSGSSATSHRKGSSSGVSEAESMTTMSSVISPVSSEDVAVICSNIWTQIHAATGRNHSCFRYIGPENAEAALFVFGTDPRLFSQELSGAKATDIFARLGLITPTLYRPWLPEQLLDALPSTVGRVAVLESVKRKTTKWGPILLDVLTSLKSNLDGAKTPLVVGYQLGHIESATATQALSGIVQNLLSDKPIQNLEIGAQAADTSLALVKADVALQQPSLENAYMKILSQLFGERLYIANSLRSNNAGIRPSASATPEYGFGSLIARKQHRKRFVNTVQAAAKSNSFATENPKKWLSDWALAADKPEQANKIAPEVISRLSADGSPLASRLLQSSGLFYNESQWLIGSDAWSYDLGNSGVHHVIASGENVNMLIIDSTPYSERAAQDAARRKKDIGLYAMNFGNVYVASVAVYSSYTQVLQAMMEAEAYNGPAVVLAYLPYNTENDSPLTVLQETKKAVDLGYWPLFRWDPEAEEKGEESFKLDSERIKQELQEFLRRDNQMSQLMRRHPRFHASLSESYGSEVRKVQKRKAKDAYEALLEGLQGAPMTVLFASDNGNAENLAKRLANRGKARGLKTMVMAMDDYPLEDLGTEENVVLITSTAGQGEFPQNGRNFWEGIKTSVDLDLASVHFTVFSLGDSHYWPRKQDKHYYNKTGKDLFARLVALGGKQIVALGLGDDQDPDGYQTGYQEWEPKLWDAMGVGKVQGLPEEPAPLTNEDMKIQSNFLRGTIEEGLQDTSTGAISASDQQLTKFHGTYMQDDRDLRDERKAQGLEPAYSFMIRCRLPGGVATSDQWLRMDAISTELGNETMKLTTRQTFQFHGVVKTKVKPAMQAINRALMTTIAACGDINRNVMCSPLPEQSALHGEVKGAAQKISDHLLPSTTAYHEIWLKDDNDKNVQVAGDAVQDFEPLYGPTYLPRKFKISIAVPPYNDVDVYAHDIGLIAIKGDDNALQGFNLVAGGGMGATHNMKKTYPQIGRMFGYVDKDAVHIACEKIMLVQRDNGDRKNRKHARLKYTIDDMGVDVFKCKVEELWGEKFQGPKPFHFDSNIDTFGWLRDENGKNHFTIFIENGRVEDTADFPMKTGLREIAKVHKGEFRLTPNQHLTLSNVVDEDLESIKALLKKYKLDNTDFSAMRLSSSACVAFPTCGLAMAESERYLPELISKLEGVVEENGLRQDSIVMRMTGCPNGCARPWLAEVAFVGKAFGAYNMYLGGGYHGQRLNKLYRSTIKEAEILEIMKPLLKRYAIERREGERFGDFVIRIGMIKETREGRDFHDDTAEVEEDE